MHSFFCFTFLLLLAGRVLSLSIEIAGFSGNISANQFLNVSDTSVLAACQTQCNNGTTAINNCGTNDTCLCDTATIAAITNCQQCMFDDLIANFAVSSDPRVGSTPALTAYVAACSSAGITVPATSVALTLPADWDGPFGVHASVAGTALTVIVGLAMGTSAIAMLCTM
ncbi:hypothetical protein SERLA73DRAFT_187938 [Serpula lacrymans var. lacrymans S7.3]|uniref:Extracellular membrane protein CFEM domain-containing protein n=2 Tax=Serpula lacrymans var. lacrymans TaxID=341189 RepID=F8Q9V2_SERL3|nr:uncharacterized protein SERLADRAFT_477846 [Serpula lacrymans var. lacrymans S7.9]EGN94857.1 hypothetical protein SERLA73DRAFT_187938 [Serpula lacrymans var. lacrymans S7.3]EGO20354.1 hypothetical protein SERLADRAFT_477846 [Serpula lacrymans var. lacrymans S7.9]